MDFKEACAIVGYDKTKNPPTRKFIYYAYLNGESYKCRNHEEALRISNITQQIVENNDEINEFWKTQTYLESKAVELFFNELRKKYSDVPVDIYNQCMSKAYDDGHYAGCDEVAIYLDEYIDFAMGVIECAKNSHFM